MVYYIENENLCRDTWLQFRIVISSAIPLHSVEAIYYKLCMRVMICCKNLESDESEEPSRRRRKVASFLDWFQGLNDRPDCVKISL